MALHVRLQLLVDLFAHDINVSDLLHNVVDRVLERLDVNFVLADLVAGRFNQSDHLVLPQTQVVHREPKGGVGNVESAQLIVHVIGCLFQLGNLLLPGLNVPLEFLDLVVEDKLELLKFLGLLLQQVDHFLPVFDLRLLLSNLILLRFDLGFQLVNAFLLLRQLQLFVLDLSAQLVDVGLDLCDFVLGDLELCLRF